MNIMNFATQPVLSVLPDDSLDRAIQLMEEHDIHHLPVLKDGKAVGMLSDRDILLSTGWMFDIERRVGKRRDGQVVGPTRVDQIMSRPVITLSSDAAARDAARMMVERKIGALPILDNDRMAGIITESDLMRWLDELALNENPADLFLQRPVHSLAPERLLSVEPDVPLQDVIDIFRRFRIRHMPVSAMGRKLLGVISDRDVRRAIGWSGIRDMQAQESGKLPEEMPTKASDLMRTELETIERGERLRDALRLMLKTRIHSLPVVESGKLNGILTMTDFTKAIVREELL